jgi:5,10-methylenetetrahydromethanopterin reductase
VLTYDFRLPPGPRTVEYALLAEELGFRAVWCPEIPAFGHDIWVTLARIAEKTNCLKFGPSVLIPSYRHPMAQASAIATVEQIAPGRLMVGFGTGFTDRAGMGKKPLTLASMRTHIEQVKALLHGDVADIDVGLAQVPRVRRLAARSSDQRAGLHGRPGPQGPRARQRDYRRPDFPWRPGRRV